ncbi:signal recognition particle-docking protein FtsY [Proteiniborus sp. MB09-C3]|nr:signal recognition particle-docking protein FtsY [Proteiniborus sp. MB09-C3]WIV10834.1 signal recognition particle-docking protein FtsY [Proteiniborus sp. MB09-C3]
MFKNLFKWGKKDKQDNTDKPIDEMINEEIYAKDSQYDETSTEDFELNEDEIEEMFSEDIQEDVENYNVDTTIDEAEAEKKNDLEDQKNVITEENDTEDKSDSEKLGFFGRLKSGLSKTRKGITEKVDIILKSYKKVEEELFEDLEEVLITADVGVNTSLAIIEELRNRVKERKVNEVSEVRELLKEVLRDVLMKGETNKLDIEPSPAIILVVGVNGVGKTTTIGKLSSRLKSEGKKVLIAAGDTFRAAAIEQLQEWGNRAGVDIISHQEGSDPAAVIFDGIQAAKARKTDVLICDTAGRLHNKKNLMNELSKIFRVVEREYPEAKKEVLLVVDATTGQNAVSQAKVFKEACDITGIVLTKLDGTAKGGVVLAVQSELNVPVKLVGVGEKIADLQDFDPVNFVEAIFEE